MQTKEYLLIGAIAVLLANVSIVATLFATGYIGHHDPEPEEEPEPVAEETLPLEPPKPSIIHSMAKAMYACEDKLNSANKGKEFSYEFDTVASRYNNDEGKYMIFIETHTSSRNNAPQQDNSVICEVSDEDLSIKGYKVLPL